MEEHFEYPEFVARFYDLIYNKIRTGTDFEYFMNKILEVKGPVLEVGTGTGRFFIEALNKGADIYGIDVSTSMINKLKEKLDKKHYGRISVQDAKKLQIDKKFDLIIAPFRVFSHMIEIKDQLKFLDNIYDHLKKKGTFIFDLFVPDLKMILEGINNLTDFEGEYEKGKKMKRIISMNSVLIKQVSYVSMTFVWEENDKEITKEWTFPFRYFFRYEIEHLVNQSKLKLEKIYGDFENNDLSPDSKEFIIVCKRL